LMQPVKKISSSKYWQKVGFFTNNPDAIWLVID
jgi:hypothetical protein